MPYTNIPHCFPLTNYLPLHPSGDDAEASGHKILGPDFRSCIGHFAINNIKSFLSGMCCTRELGQDTDDEAGTEQAVWSLDVAGQMRRYRALNAHLDIQNIFPF